LSTTIELEPEHSEAYYNRSNVYLQLEEEEKSCSDMRQSASLGYEAAFNYVASLCQQ